MKLVISEAINGWSLYNESGRRVESMVVEKLHKNEAHNFTNLLLAVTDLLMPDSPTGYKLIIATLPTVETAKKKALSKQERMQLEQLREEIEDLLDGEGVEV